jgi:hypothetical protein
MMRVLETAQANPVIVPKSIRRKIGRWFQSKSVAKILDSMEWAKKTIPYFWYYLDERDFNAPWPDFYLTFGVGNKVLFDEEIEAKTKEEWTTNNGRWVRENWSNSFLQSDILPKFEETPPERGRTLLTNRFGARTTLFLDEIQATNLNWDTVGTLLTRIRELLEPYTPEKSPSQIYPNTNTIGVATGLLTNLNEYDTLRLSSNGLSRLSRLRDSKAVGSSNLTNLVGGTAGVPNDPPPVHDSPKWRWCGRGIMTNGQGLFLEFSMGQGWITDGHGNIIS